MPIVGERGADLTRPTPREPGGPRAVIRVLQVLSEVSVQPQGITLSELAHQLALPKTTLHTMLRVLVAARYLVLSDGRFCIGSEAVQLGASLVGAPRVFPDCIKGLLEDLAERTGETALCAQLTPDLKSCRYVASAETRNWLRFSVPVGSLRPAYATGSGQAMLAFLSSNDLRKALAGVRFERVTPRTVGSRLALLRSLAQVRERGISSVDSGTVAGVTALAAPIFDAAGICIAAVTVGGPTARLERRLAELETAVIEAAEQSSRMMGFSNAWPQASPDPKSGRRGLKV